jgi:hypothetical protein
MARAPSRNAGEGQGQRHGAQDSRARAENGSKDEAIKDYYYYEYN